MSEQDALNRARELGLEVYSRRPDEDVLISLWWDYVRDNGDLPKIASRGARPLSGFFGMFTPPNFLVYSTMPDEQMIEFAGWFTPEILSDKGFYYSNWVHPNIRGTRRQLTLSAAIYDSVWYFANVIVGITKQEKLLKRHYKVGYTYAGAIPWFFDSDPAYILYLTEKAYKASKFYSVTHKEK